MTVKVITPTECFQTQEKNNEIQIIDVREPDEFSEVRSPLAHNFPLSSFDVAQFAKVHNRQTALYLLCRSGKRSQRAADMLVKEGFKAVHNIDGGMIAWEAAGLPVVRG